MLPHWFKGQQMGNIVFTLDRVTANNSAVTLEHLDTFPLSAEKYCQRGRYPSSKHTLYPPKSWKWQVNSRYSEPGEEETVRPHKRPRTDTSNVADGDEVPGELEIVTRTPNDCFPGLMKVFYSRDIELSTSPAGTHYVQPVREGGVKECVTKRSLTGTLGQVNFKRACDEGLVIVPVDKKASVSLTAKGKAFILQKLLEYED